MNRERVREGPDHAMKRKRVSEGPDQQRTARVCEVEDGDPIKPDKDIFLSHSGSQKQLADHVADELGREGYEVFYDKDPSSLPGGHQFPPRILEAARKAKLLIVIISDEYFMSKWPMIELSAFVQAHNLHCSTSQESRSSTEGPMLLPLFFELSVDDVKNPENQSKWFSQWEILARKDERINVGEWKDAFNVLPKFNGLPFDKKSKEYVAYVKKILSTVLRCIPPRREWDLSHVQGRPGIVKEIEKKIKEVNVSKYGMKVVGLYGVGGIGKTTACMSLCNEFLGKFKGRVCHLDIQSKKIFRQISIDLTRKSMDDIKRLKEAQVKKFLSDNLSKQRTFLAIDNVVGNKSTVAAKELLRFKYHKDSLVVVTARSQALLTKLGLDNDACLELPELGKVDAVKLFLYYAAPGKGCFTEEDEEHILTCVKRCFFFKGGGRGSHYHPLALKVLGSRLDDFGPNPSVWVQELPVVRNFDDHSQENPVFDILRSGFDVLPLAYQTLFMDVVRFPHFVDPPRRLHPNVCDEVSVLDWLCMAHNEDAEEILRRLKHLKERGLLMDVDSKSGKVIVHDLYREFAELLVTGSLQKWERKNCNSEVEGYFRSWEMWERKWVHVAPSDKLTELEVESMGRHSYEMNRLTILSRPQFEVSFGRKWYHDVRDQVPRHYLGRIKWDSFPQLEVLHLEEVDFGHEALNLGGLGRLRILKLLNVFGIDRIEGLGRAYNLIYFYWGDEYFNLDDETSEDVTKELPPEIVGQLPPSLKELRIENRVVVGPDLLAQCRCLSTLMLLYAVTIHGGEACSLDLSNCRSLECIKIVGVENLSGLDGCRESKLKSLQQVPNAGNSCEGPILVGFKRLEVLDLSYSSGFESLAGLGLGALPSLRVLNLEYCEDLLQLPDLKMSTNLEELHLYECPSLRIYDEDIEMLKSLPRLDGMPFLEQVAHSEDLARGSRLYTHLCSGCYEQRCWACIDFSLLRSYSDCLRSDEDPECNRYRRSSECSDCITCSDCRDCSVCRLVAWPGCSESSAYSGISDWSEDECWGMEAFTVGLWCH